MPKLPCPACGFSIEVAISRAGSEVACPSCEKIISVPKLGELRRLAADADAAPSPAVAGGTPIGLRAAFACLIGIAAIAAVFGGYCLVRFASIPKPPTTADHLAEVETVYPQLAAAQLVREWQTMESFTEAFAHPYEYQMVANVRRGWLVRGLIGLGIAAALTIAAAVMMRTSRRPT